MIILRLEMQIPAAICGISFTAGLIFVTGAGEYWVSLFDGYASTTGLVIIALLETISIMYIYGHERYLLFLIIEMKMSIF